MARCPAEKPEAEGRLKTLLQMEDQGMKNPR